MLSLGADHLVHLLVSDLLTAEREEVADLLGADEALVLGIDIVEGSFEVARENPREDLHWS